MKTRILIVDDEPEFVEVLSERLGLRDYDVTTSSSGKDATEKLEKLNFDVVILDVLMPDMDGIETLKKIKGLKPLTEVIMLTGHATVETAIEGMKLGAYDYLMKPYKDDDLFSKIDKASAKKGEHEERIREAKVKEIVSSPRSVLSS
ncbi:MAG: response regulator [Desulfobacteraceae bacterium]|jgi:DNA-binding NtrC family response regulator